MNNASITGRLGKDIELRYAESGTAIARFTVAVDRFTKGKRDTDWINVTAFGKQAENASQYLHKGSKCGVTGSIKTGSYEKQDGTRVNTFEIWAERVEFLDSKSKASEVTVERQGFEQQDKYQQMGFRPVDDSDIPL
jgi:single-strand DNA-binding protein